ncbi:DUF3796 domain-containing protein [Clostridium sardiniense]|uniref:DUF3796 domain-containing protein n=1 Tax=Clostridium sardiniense TaxID=29369 RepID=A0ABS7KX40_CLOSR|nr:DUF3796 domain-containing protein [Clostridium sardiniense]MBY0755361.1 DUF3796 domain-containing protein [Clostridium sardiniense]MDQ0459807.1 hypothetical protein [Clostridium sardiniense]
MKKSKVKSWYGILGFSGFGGFAGILNSSFYMFFIFFAFFSFFWEGKINYELDDERLQYNIMKAKSTLFDISSILMIVCILAFNNGVTAEIFKIILSLYFEFLAIGKSFLTYYYETKGM